MDLPLRDTSLGLLTVRIAVGGLMLFHGVAKFTNSGSMGFISTKLTEAGLPAALAYGVYLGEVIAPLMLLIGLFCRLGGLIIAGNMVFAVYLVHMHELGQLNQTGGWALELQALFLLGGLALYFTGSGRYAARPD